MPYFLDEAAVNVHFAIDKICVVLQAQAYVIKSLVVISVYYRKIVHVLAFKAWEHNPIAKIKQHSL